jgi:hypothetical protein
LLVVFPGSQFKNYIPMVCLANALALVHVASGRSASGGAFLRGIALGGFVLGVTFLIRIDIGYLCAVMWVGLIVLRLFDARFPFRERRKHFFGASAILAAVVLLLHVPAYAAAVSGGYAPEFTKQYSGWANFLRGEAESLVTDAPGGKAEDAPAIAPKPGRKARTKA